MTLAACGGIELSVASLSAAGRRRRIVALAALSSIAAAAALASIAIGSVSLTPLEVVRALFGWSEAGSRESAIVNAIRAPRALLGLCVGAALGVCGAALQGLFRNPLADPGLIGVSGGAALAAALVIVLGAAHAPDMLRLFGPYAQTLAAFGGGLAALFAVFLFGRRCGQISAPHMLLAGVAVNAIAGAGVGYLTFISTDEQLRTLTFWMLGSLGGATWERTLPAAAVMLAAACAMLRHATPLNAYLLGEREARHLGVDVERLKRGVLLLSALAVGAAVAVTGVIGFVGLVAPHIMRMMLGADHRAVLPSSALLGAVLVLAADCVARTAVAPAELPIGVLTSAIGGPFFLWLLSRRSAV